MDTYKSLGASAEKEDVHAAIRNQDAGEYPNAFCKLMPDPADDAYVCALHADGAGTKSSLAYVKYRETGDVSAFEDIAQDSIVMNLDDLICAGATGPFFMSNTIGRNAHLVGAEAVSAVVRGYENFIEKMRPYGVDIRMCGGETADVGDLVRTLIVDSTFYTRLPRKNVIDLSNVKDCDFIVGLSSFGQAKYESKYNAGMGSNGLTAARHMLLDKSVAQKYPESYSPTVAKPYTGRFGTDDILPGTANIKVIDAILSPTRTYAPVIAAAVKNFGGAIHGIIHSTGGAHLKCLNFMKQGTCVYKDNLFDAPPLFAALAASGTMSEREMYGVFNMGCRMEIYTDWKHANDIVALAESFGIAARIIGRVERGSDPSCRQLRINSVLGDRTKIFEYKK